MPGPFYRVTITPLLPNGAEVGDPPPDAAAEINLDSARVYPDNKSCRANTP